MCKREECLQLLRFPLVSTMGVSVSVHTAAEAHYRIFAVIVRGETSWIILLN